MKYYIIDLSITYEDGLPENGWFIDGEGNVCYEFETPQEFVDSLLYNIGVSVEYQDYVDQEQAYIKILAELLQNNYVEVNGFGFSIEN
jgi:hypothetical protein